MKFLFLSEFKSEPEEFVQEASAALILNSSLFQDGGFKHFTDVDIQ
jgi:hypothetical protein